MTEPLDLAGQQALQKEKRNTWSQVNPQGITIMRSFAPGHVQYGCCACIPAPAWCPGLGAMPCCTPPTYIRKLIAASKFIHVTENGLLWNFAFPVPRDECFGLPCNLCELKAGDGVTFLPWDNPAWDRISVSRFCRMCDSLTTGPLGFCCGPYNCSTFWCKMCPFFDVWPCKVYFIEGCDERKQYCEGGYGTNIKLTQLYCNGLCVKAIPGICCLWPAALIPIGKLCCLIPNAYDVFVRPEDYEEFMSYLKQTRDERLKVINAQPR